MRSRGRPWSTVLLVLAVLLPVDLPAARRESAWQHCLRRFAIEGVLPGMTVREVRKAVGKGEDVTREEGGERFRGTIWHYPDRAEMTVRFDRPVSEGKAARVVEVRIRWDGPDGRTSIAVASAVTRLGDPTSGGAERPIDPIRHGPVVWTDPVCGLEATAYHEPGPWWNPEAPSLFLKVVALPLSGSQPPDNP